MNDSLKKEILKEYVSLLREDSNRDFIKSLRDKSNLSLYYYLLKAEEFKCIGMFDEEDTKKLNLKAELINLKILISQMSTSKKR